MNYIDDLALKIYQLAKAIENGKPPTSYPASQEFPLYRIYAVLALTKGEAVTLRDVHDAWSAWQAGIRSDHHSLIPFEHLSLEVQEYDRPFAEAIHIASRQLEISTP